MSEEVETIRTWTCYFISQKCGWYAVVEAFSREDAMDQSRRENPEAELRECWLEEGQ